MATDPVVAGEARLFGSGEDLLARHAAADQQIEKAMSRAAVPDVVLSILGWGFYAFALGFVFIVVVNGISAGGRSIGELFLAFYLVREPHLAGPVRPLFDHQLPPDTCRLAKLPVVADHAAAQERSGRSIRAAHCPGR